MEGAETNQEYENMEKLPDESGNEEDKAPEEEEENDEQVFHANVLQVAVINKLLPKGYKFEL